MTHAHFGQLRLAAGACLLAAALTACGGSSKSSSSTATTTTPTASTAAGDTGVTTSPTSGASGGSSSSVDVCSLLTAAQASSITGVAYTTTHPSSGPTTATCAYTGSSVPTPMNVTVTSNASSAAAWTDELATLKEGGGKDPVALNGLGDRAATSTGTLGTQSGNWVIQVDGGDSTSVGGTFTKSSAVARALIAALH